jgi:hypothetical protein
MVSKKSILWTLAFVVVAAAATAIWQNQVRHQRKAAAADEARAKARKQKSSAPEEDPVEKTPPPAPKKAPKATALSTVDKEHLAEKAFIAALREVFVWRNCQPGSVETNRALLEKLSAIACEDMPPERKSAWQSLLQARKAMDDPARVADPKLQAQSQQAAGILNAMLKAHGDGDIAL